MSFGASGQDFMLVVNKASGGNTCKDKTTEKHLFAMATSKVRERKRERGKNKFFVYSEMLWRYKDDFVI